MLETEQTGWSGLANRTLRFYRQTGAFLVEFQMFLEFLKMFQFGTYVPEIE
jgi:hypothetical protein